MAVYDAGQLTAHATAFLVDQQLDIFAQGPLSAAVGSLRKRWKNFLVMRSLECGSSICPGSTMQIKKGADVRRTLDLVCGEMEKLARATGAKMVLFRDFYDSEKDIRGALEKNGYGNIHNLPQAEIELRWKSFKDYLGAMRSSYRCNIVKNMEKCAKAGVSLQVTRDVSQCSISDMKRLYDNVYDRAREVKRERLSESFFHSMSRNLAKDTAVVSAFKDGKMIGYMFLLLSGGTVITKFPGIDYDHNKESFTYFNIFYKTIEFAIERGMKKVDMGITTLNPKRDMGSNVLALNMYVKFFNPLLNRLVPLVFDMVTPPDTSAPRNVFKDLP
jgi:predicted N-acyltransferase